MQKKFPISLQKILPAAIIAGVLTGCHSATSVEASTDRDPVVAPAGTVLRVRLNRALSTERSRPGDRFDGVLDSAVSSDVKEILPKGTKVEGHVVATREPGQSVLSVTLDWFECNGERRPLLTTVVTRTESRPQPRESVMLQELNTDSLEPAVGAGSVRESAGEGSIVIPAQSIVGFTLKEQIAL